MEDSTIHSAQSSLARAAVSPTIAKSAQVQSQEVKPKSPVVSSEKQETQGFSPTSAQFLELLEKFKQHPLADNQDLSPTNEHPRIDAIKRAEELLLNDTWPSQETLDTLARVLAEQFD